MPPIRRRPRQGPDGRGHHGSLWQRGRHDVRLRIYSSPRADASMRPRRWERRGAARERDSSRGALPPNAGMQLSE